MSANACELVLPMDTAFLELAGQFVSFVAARAGFPEREVARIRLAVDEACANAVLHSPPVGSDGRFRIICDEVGGQLEVRVLDSGPMFELAELPEPDLEVPLEKRNVGGLGVYLMRRVMDSVELRPREGGKEIVLSKSLPDRKGEADGD